MKHQFRLLLFIFLIAAQSGFAQDKHFSQFFANPITLNPALSGAFDGRLRLAGIYRDQWRDQLSEPYVTFAGSLDMRVPVGKKGSNYKDALGVGILFFSDKASPLEFSTNKIAVALAYHKALNPKNTQYLSLGVQGGIEQRNINFGNINFSDQFDGTQGYSDPSAEDLPQNNFAYADFGVGLNYTLAPKGKTALFLGGAIHHFLTPSLSFYNIDAEETGEFFPESKLFIKYSAHLALQVPIAERMQLLPRANFQLQGPHFAANAGSNIRFLVGQYSGTALHVGAWVRGVATESVVFEPDALVGMLGIEYQNVLFGFSYDMNLKTLSGTSTGQGAFEISVAYLGNYENETVLCPKF